MDVSDVMPVVNGVGTMVIVMMIVDRCYKLALRWLELGRPDIYGPAPIQIRDNRIIQLTEVVDEPKDA